MAFTNTVVRGFQRTRKRLGRVDLHVSMQTGYGSRRALTVSIADDENPVDGERRSTAVKLVTTIEWCHLQNMVHVLIGMSTLETKLSEAVRMGVESQRQGEESSATFYHGKAAALVETLRIIRATGNDEMGKHKEDHAQLEKLWEDESERQESRAKTFAAMSRAFSKENA
jgi:hypothetical protein